MPGFRSKSLNAAAVWLADDDGNPVSTGGTDAAPQVTRFAQGTPTHTTATLAANTPQTILAASATRVGARVLNWTASPVFIMPGTTGTPNSTAPSDFIPAAVSGVPGQFEPPYSPTTGLRAVSAAAGDLTVESW